MSKLARKLTPCTSQEQKRKYHPQDRISELPDEVLILILSRIPTKEAARTSLLSRRWEKLWTFSPRLDFDGSKRLFNFLFQLSDIEFESQRVKELLDLERVGYINWVNHFLESYHFRAIDEYRVRFDLDERYRGDIDEWVRFAFQKKVKRFELDFSSYWGSVGYNDCSYPFCLQTLPSPSSISLTSLILKQVNVSDEVLENFLSNSPFLESLCVAGSSSLVHLRVAGSSLCLKYVEVAICENLESLELHAASLLSLKYNGSYITIPFTNIPNLVELSIAGEDLLHFVRKMPLHSMSFSQLHKLALGIKYYHMSEMKRLKYPILGQLKQLELHVDASDGDSLLVCSPLIEASPSLNRLALELVWFDSSLTRKVKKARKSPHHSLKVVEVTGFVGQTIDTEFCTYLIKNAVMLEKIIIDPCMLFVRGTPLEKDYVEMVKAARECAEQLRSKYSLGDKLVILNGEE